MVAVPKATHRRPRSERTANLLKPPPRERKPPKPLKRTGFCKPGTWQLKRSAATRAGVIRGVRQTTGFALKRGQKLKPLGVRGKRLLPGDRRESQAIKGLPCICGCCLPVQWAHLIPRGAETTRHDPTYSVPACEYLHPWLDQGRGVQAKTELRNLATESGRRVTPEEAFEILSRWNYYTDLADRGVKER